jgi:rhodanese-related sulfurtransferase
MSDSITRDALLEKINRGDQFYLFEVLPRMYWRKHHLPGARSLPLEDVESTIATLVPDKRAEIIVYCWNFT